MRGILINACGNDNWIWGLYYAKNIAFELSQNDWKTRNYKIVVYTQRDNLSVFKGLPDDVIVLNRKNRDSIFSKLFKPPPHNSANMRICKSKAVFTAYHLIHTAEWVY